MNISRFALSLFTVNAACDTTAFALAIEGPLEQRPHFRAPQAVVEMFLQAVDRGELVVFDRRISKSMLVPIRIEYVYELKYPVPKVKVYSELREPMPVPGQENCRLRGISATLDAGGSIIETEAHVWSE
ncbi:MAG: hypothetical protein KDI74_07975 [Gammaproteobacteria bacterium]|nr:hypothetical protein [Gammaproteobacteria bacterium]